MLTLAIQHALAVLRDRKGVTALEYGVLAAGIIAVIAATIFLIGTQLSSTFSNVNHQL